MIAPIENPMTTGQYGEGNTTHFTPRHLAEEIVRYTLQPLTYHPGPAQGADPEDWRRRPAHELLRLPTTDPACGSGAMLLAAIRYRAAHVHLAMEDHLRERPRKLHPRDEDEPPLISAAAATRQTVRSIYGNDVNPFSVEVSRLVMAMAAHTPGLPLIPMETNIVWGDSLVGAVKVEDLSHQQGVDLPPIPDLDQALGEAAYLRGAAMLTPILTEQDARECRVLFAMAAERTHHIRVRADLIFGALLREFELPKTRIKTWSRLTEAATMLTTATEDTMATQATRWLARDIDDSAIRPLHYLVAYPEVFTTPRRMDPLPEFEPDPIPDEVGQTVQADYKPLVEYLNTTVEEQVRALYPLGAQARAALLGDDGPRCEDPHSSKGKPADPCRGLLDILAVHSEAIAVGPPKKATKKLTRELARDRGMAAYALATTLAIAALDAPGGVRFAGRFWLATTQLPHMSTTATLEEPSEPTAAS